MKIKLLIVDDHLLVRELLRERLESQEDMSVIGEAGDGKTAIKMAKKLQRDIVVMDIGLPGLDGIEATRQIKIVCPKARVVILTMHDTKQALLQGRWAGALGYVIKGDPIGDLLAAIRRVHRGQSFFSRSLTDDLFGEFLDQAEQKASDGLSPREREVLRLVVLGWSYQEIADALQIALSTVSNHSQRIRKKLNCRTKADLVRYGLLKGEVLPA